MQRHGLSSMRGRCNTEAQKQETHALLCTSPQCVRVTVDNTIAENNYKDINLKGF